MKTSTLLLAAGLLALPAYRASAQQLESENSVPAATGVTQGTRNSPEVNYSSSEISAEANAEATSTPGKPAIASVPDDKHEQRMNKLWYGSIGLMLAASTADAITSWHKQEANGLLASNNGTFGGKAIGIKFGVMGAVLIPQILFHRHTELRKGFIIGNLIDAGVFGGTAIHNVAINTK